MEKAVKSIKSVQEFCSIFTKIPQNIVLAALIIFHFTLYTGNFSTALEKIFSFYYDPQNADIIELIRNILVNAAVFSWVLLFYRSILNKLTPAKIECTKQNDDTPTKKPRSYATQKFRIETTALYITFTEYFLDILRYYNKNFVDFWETIYYDFKFSLSVLVVSFFVYMVFIIIHDRYSWRKL